jgi:hypothetical protein
VTTKGFERKISPNPCCHGLLYRVQQKNLMVFKKHCAPNHWSGRSALEPTCSSIKSNFVTMEDWSAEPRALIMGTFIKKQVCGCNSAFALLAAEH